MALFNLNQVSRFAQQVVPRAQALMAGPGAAAVGGKVIGQQLSKEGGVTTPRPNEQPLTNPQSTPPAPQSTLQTAARGSSKLFEGKLFGLPKPVVLIAGGLLAYKFLIS